MLESDSRVPQSKFVDLECCRKGAGFRSRTCYKQTQHCIMTMSMTLTLTLNVTEHKLNMNLNMTSNMALNNNNNKQIEAQI